MLIKKHLVLSLFLLAIGNQCFADEGKGTSPEDRWNNLSPEKQAAISEKAAAKGYDLSTAEGRETYFKDVRKRHHAKKMRRHHRKDRKHVNFEDRWNKLSPEKQDALIAKAAEKGFDITTEDGRKAFRDARRDKHAQVRDRIRDLSPEDRQSLRKDMKGLDRQQRRELIRQRLGS